MLEQYYVYDSTYDLTGQIFGWFAFAAAFIRFQMKTTIQIRFMNIVSCTLFAIHYSFLLEWAGAIMFMIAGFRSILLMFARFWQYKNTIAIGAVILSAMTLFFTFSQWYHLMPLIAIFLGALMDIQPKAVFARLFGGLMHIFWLIYAISTGSQGGTLNSGIVIFSNLSGFWRHHLYPYIKTKDKTHFDM